MKIISISVQQKILRKNLNYKLYNYINENGYCFKCEILEYCFYQHLIKQLKHLYMTLRNQ